MVPFGRTLAVPCRVVPTRRTPQVLIFLSGRLPNAEVAVGVTGLCLQFSTLVWLSASAISSATTTRVANALGKVGCRGQVPGAMLGSGCRTLARNQAGTAQVAHGQVTERPDPYAIQRGSLPVTR